MTCPLCGAPSDEGALRCPQCGSLLPGAGPDPGGLPVYGAASDQPGEPGPEVEVVARQGASRGPLVAVAVVALLVGVGVVSAGRALTGGASAGRARELGTTVAFDLPAPVERTPERAWQRPFDANRVIGAGDSVLAADAESGDLVSLAAEDGEERWRVEPPAAGLSIVWLSPLAGDDVLVSYAPEDAVNPAMQLAAVDARSGRIRWRYDPDGVAFSFRLTEDLLAVYRSTSFREPLSMTILSAVGGNERWKVQGESAAFGPRTIYVSRDGVLVAHDLETGDERWRRSLPTEGGHFAAGAESAGTVVLARDDRTVVGYSAEDGSFLWSRSAPRPVQVVRTTEHEVIAIGDGAFGLDPGTGEVLWTSRSDAWAVESLLQLDGRDGVYSVTDRLAVLDAETGTRLATATGLRVGSSMPFLQPGFADGVLYLTGDAEELVGVDADTLEPRWSLDTGISLDELVAADDTVVVVSDDELVAYR